MAEYPQYDNRRISRTESILTPELLKKRFLSNVELKLQSGEELPPEVIMDHILDAYSMLETDLDISILPIQMGPDNPEEKDYRRNDYYEWGYFQLNNIPVISVEAVNAVYPNSVVLSYPKDWYKIQPHDGILRLIPVSGSAAMFMVQGDGSWVPELFAAKNSVPLVWQIQYTAGFADGKIPRNVNLAVGMLATILILNDLGSGVLAPGITSTSLSIDGLSESLNTSMSASSHAYSGLLAEIRKVLFGEPNNPNNPGLMANLRAFWKGSTLNSI